MTYLRIWTRFSILVFFTNASLLECRGETFGLTSFFISNRRLRVVVDGTFSQIYPVNAVVPQGSILGPTLFLLYINDLPDDVICNNGIYAGHTTLYSIYDQVSDLW